MTTNHPLAVGTKIFARLKNNKIVEARIYAVKSKYVEYGDYYDNEYWLSGYMESTKEIYPTRELAEAE